jgi:ectoine hydroxylase-related dioxygenase (phytanoyl-CoA dioxygenase family)
MTTTFSFEDNGYAIVPDVLSDAQCAAAASQVQLSEPGAGGTRCLLSQPWCASLASSLRAHPALATVVRADHVAVQCNYFEKSAGRNWLVPVHQDLSIPVAARVDHPALGGWSEKEGTLFVRAPEPVLAQMVAVRLHLDVCGADDGPLRVVPGSHRGGVLGAQDVLAVRDAGGEVTCLLAAGGALVLRPLLLHASSKGKGSSRRRVLHFVFGPAQLPFGLAWNVAA